MFFWAVNGGCGIYLKKLAYLTTELGKLCVEYILIRIGESVSCFNEFSCLFGLF